MKKITQYLIAIMLLIVLSSCNLTKQYINPSDPNAVSTYAMQTVQALATEQAFSTLVSNATDVSNLPTANVVEETAKSGEEPTQAVATATATVTFIHTYTDGPGWIC